MDSKAKELKGTFIGLTTILMFSTLALLTAYCDKVPPFQLTAMAFTVASMVGLVLMKVQGNRIADLFRQPLSAWVLGISGLFGFHFFYFMALKQAPVIEASLISYLWPLLIVLFSAFLPGERLRWFHLVGAVCGLIGASMLVTKGASFSFNPQYALGYGSALLCALTWAGYSVLSRLFGSVPTFAVTGFCALTAILSLVFHLIFETTVWPQGYEWLPVLGLGLGPVGGAFFTWDIGMKTGNIRALGAGSYAAPLLSTLLLIGFGLADVSWVVAVACVLIVGGSLLAAGEYLGLR